MNRFSFDIDITGACNLRCPSCPQGSIKSYRLPQGFMEPGLLSSIVKKAKSECRVAGIGLFNWAEPMLHPRLPELVRIVQDAGISCFLSSNLNILRNADEIMEAGPFSFRISASGFTQETYGWSHRGGEIEKVKKNMAELADAKKRRDARTRIYVYYHRYMHNLKEEPLMREFAARLGIGFQPVWALFFPVEKILSHADREDPDFPITDEDRELIGRLALPLEKALAVSKGHQGRPCTLRESQISVDFLGNVQLCCGIFHSGKFTIGNYLDMGLEDIQSARRKERLCDRCTLYGVHLYLTYALQELDQAALMNVAPEDSELLGLSYEISQKQVRRRLEALYERIFAGVITTGQKAAIGDLFERLQRMVGRAKRIIR